MAMAQTSNSLMPVRVPANQVFDQKTVIFVSDEWSLLGLLSSSVHQCWAMRYASTMRQEISYEHTDVFETLPLADPTPLLGELAEELSGQRSQVMRERALGLTKTYNLVHDPAVSDRKIVRLREIHEQIDHAVLAAYGWDDLDPQIGHHATKIGTRWTVSPEARFELLDRLLVENHRRATLENP